VSQWPKRTALADNRTDREIEAAETLRARSHWRKIRRIRLVVSVAICGGGVGVAALYLVFLAATEYPKTPEHLDFTNALILGLGAFVPTALLAAAITWAISERVENARGILVWVGVGFSFGISSSFVTGLFIPFGTVFVRFFTGKIAAGDVFVDAVDSLFRGISVAFSHGAFGVFTGMTAGVILSVGAYVIDRTNSMLNLTVQRFAPPTIAVVIAIIVVAIASFGPVEFLAKLG